jgi:hypothetical protein
MSRISVSEVGYDATAYGMSVMRMSFEYLQLVLCHPYFRNQHYMQSRPRTEIYARPLPTPNLALGSIRDGSHV